MRRDIAIRLNTTYLRIEAQSQDAMRARPGRRFGKNFADEADKAASKSDLPDRLVRDVEEAAGDIEKARVADVPYSGNGSCSAHHHLF